MNKPYLLTILFGILFLFLVQSAGTLVESIYIMDLMNSSLDAKVLGILFFFTPLLALPFYVRYRRSLIWIFYATLLIAHGLIPSMNTASRIPASGIATGAAFSLFFLLTTAQTQAGQWGAAGLALAVGLSTFIRTLGDGIEFSLTPSGGWVGWGLGLLLGWLLALSKMERESTRTQTGKRVIAPILGIYLIITLVYFSFSAPAVIARWTEGNYTLIVIIVSLLSIGWAWISINRPGLIERISPRILILWNLLFTTCLTLTLLAHRVSFPPTLESLPVVVGSPNLLQQIPLGLMLLLFPVLFLDLQIFLQRVRQAAPSPRDLAPGILLGSFALVILVFANIFTNVWGYVRPVSPPFRNTYWLSYFLLSGGISILIGSTQRNKESSALRPVGAFTWAWALLLGAIFLGTLIFALPARRIQADETGKTSLRVMTFNTQQSNDDFGEKSVEAQLALIRKVSPDVLAMQETDSTRISLNNNDYVRYFAEKLGYYSYYGPTTVTGTYGTAILSKYPLLNTRAVFIYSDKDETGVAEAEIEVNGLRFYIYNVHPDSSDPAMLVFAQTLLARSRDKPYVIALGDYNLRDYEEAYKLIDSVYTNAWVSVYPSEIGDDGVDMSGDNRIDHIFLSPNLKASHPVYILPPASATDHPVHWAEILWSHP